MTSAAASLPTGLMINNSSLPGVGRGVFSTTEIPKGVRFGPYKGKKIGGQHITDETNTSYMWEVMYYTKLMSSIVMSLCRSHTCHLCSYNNIPTQIFFVTKATNEISGVSKFLTPIQNTCKRLLSRATRVSHLLPSLMDARPLHITFPPSNFSLPARIS